MQRPSHRRNRLEALERRLFLSAPPHRAVHHPQPPAVSHVLIISVDGLHQADVTDPALQQSLATIEALKQQGISYSHASTTHPSDSFPGTLAYLTGAGPGTTGVFYDDSYSRTLFAPGSNPAKSSPGTEVQYAENIDKNQNLISGGGNFDASSIDPAQLPLDKNGNPVYPHSFLKVNTIFNVAHDAGLFTAYADKHPAYEIVNGPSGNGLDEFYAVEVNSTTALLDPSTGKTVNADALVAANPFTDVSKYTLVDPSTDPLGPKDPNLELTTNNVLLTERNDDVRVQGILNEINGMNPLGTKSAKVPNLFGFNFQAVSVAEKDTNGGVTLLPNGQAGPPTNLLKAAMAHTDASINAIVGALKANKLWSSTLIALTAKHGQTPRVGNAGLMKDSTLPDLLNGKGITVAQATQDDVSLIYLKDQTQTAAAVSAIQALKASGTIDVYFKGNKITLPASQIVNQVLSGDALQHAGLGNPAANSTTPDIIVTLKPGYIWVGNPLNFAHKNGEHGGFSADDTHVPLILSTGNTAASFSGQVISKPVATKQIAVTVLEALGLDPHKLQGAMAEHTQALPFSVPGQHDQGGDNNQQNRQEKQVASLFNGLDQNKDK